MSDSPRICDYEGSDYRTRFWEEQGRSYEDRVERIALRRLLPVSGDTLIDIGAGYGRLASEFSGYKRVVLFDYSRSLLLEAQKRMSADPRFIYVAGNWYRMPFVSGLFDTLVQVRTIHHAADVPLLLSQLSRIIRPGGGYVLEFANKHHLKAILRYWLGRQRWSPFALEPVEFVELNFDFHPRWMQSQLEINGFKPKRTLTVSHFRQPLVKKLIPAGLLAGLDGIIQWSGEYFQLSPSVFVFSQGPAAGQGAAPGTFFACPECQTTLDASLDDRLPCPNDSCQLEWPVADNIYDFRRPLG